MNAGLSPAGAGHEQASLEAACSALDTAVKSLARNDGETVMANADLVALLLRVVEAQRRLTEIAYPKRSSPPASLR
jgi:hypothetical protein